MACGLPCDDNECPCPSAFHCTTFAETETCCIVLQSALECCLSAARLRQALQRSFESTFALYNFPVCLAGCNVLSTGGHGCVPVRRLSRLHLHHSCVLAMQPRKKQVSHMAAACAQIELKSVQPVTGHHDEGGACHRPLVQVHSF